MALLLQQQLQNPWANPHLEFSYFIDHKLDKEKKIIFLPDTKLRKL